MGARDEEIRGRQPEQPARGMFFDCEFCIRPDDRGYHGPTVTDEGEPMAPWEVLEAYNQRRYEHYQRDFPDGVKALREHLIDRAWWWTRELGKDAREAALQSIDATVEMLGRRRQREADERRRGVA